MKLKIKHLCAAISLFFETVSDGFELLHYDAEASDASPDGNAFVYLIGEQKDGGVSEFRINFAAYPMLDLSSASSADDFNVMENLNQSPCGTHDSGRSGIKNTGQAPENFSHIKSMDEQMSFAESRPHASLGVFCAKCKSFSSKLQSAPLPPSGQLRSNCSSRKLAFHATCVFYE